MNRSHVMAVALALSLVGNVFFSMQYATAMKQAATTKANVSAQQTNDKVVAFTKLFIEKVLKAKVEVDFETRLQLENAVRDLHDEVILTHWTRFVESKTEAEAQEEVKNLLEVLVGKMKVGN